MFQDGRNEVRDDERCWRVRNVITSELVKNIHNFLDEDYLVTIGAISLQFRVGVANVQIIVYKLQHCRTFQGQLLEAAGIAFARRACRTCVERGELLGEKS